MFVSYKKLFIRNKKAVLWLYASSYSPVPCLMLMLPALFFSFFPTRNNNSSKYLLAIDIYIYWLAVNIRCVSFTI